MKAHHPVGFFFSGIEMALRSSPTTRLGWFAYYAKRFEKTLSDQTQHLACWYWLLHLEDDT